MDNNDLYNLNNQQGNNLGQQTYDYSQQQQTYDYNQQQQSYDYTQQQQTYDYNQQQQNQFDPLYAPQSYAPDQYNQQAYQYNQQAYPNNLAGYPVAPQFDKKYISPEDNQRANILCIISLLCHFVVPFLGSFFMGGLSGVITETNNESSGSALASLLSLVVSVSYLASWVLMIIVRVKYKNNTFGKVIMWIYIIILALAVIAVIILIVTCINIIRECNF